MRYETTITQTNVKDLKDEEQIKTINICQEIADKYLSRKTGYEITCILINLLGNFLESITDIEHRKFVSEKIMRATMEIVTFANNIGKKEND